MRLRRGISLWAGLTCIICLASAKPAASIVTLTPSLSVSELWIDNLFFTETNKQSDFATLVSPALQLLYDSKNFSLSATYVGIGQIYYRHPNTNGYSQNVLTSFSPKFLTRRFQNLEVSVTENLSFSPTLRSYSFAGIPGTGVPPQAGEPGSPGVPPGSVVPTGPGPVISPGVPGAPGSPPVFSSGLPLGGLAGITPLNQGIVYQQADTLSNIAGINLNYHWTSRVSTGLSYNNYFLTFPNGEFPDSMTHFSTLSARYGWSPQTGLWTSYSNSISKTQGSSSVVSHTVLVGADHQFSPRVSGYASVGASESGGTTGFATNSGISWYGEKVLFSLGYTQGIGTAGAASGLASLNQGLIGYGSWNFAKRWSAFLSLSYVRFDSLAENAFTINTFQASPGISVGLSRYLSANLFYSYTRQDSTGVSLATSAERNLVMVTLSATGIPWQFFK